jgi:hypothetical protein
MQMLEAELKRARDRFGFDRPEVMRARGLEPPRGSPGCWRPLEGSGGTWLAA